MISRLRSETVTLTYGDAPVVHDLSLDITEGTVTSIIGPNGCGKSTLLRALARLMRPQGGAVYLDGQLIHQLPTREVAKRLGLLHQQTVPPSGITVEDLVRRGRYPHQSFLQPPSRRDTEAVDQALVLTGMEPLRRRLVDQLSGGQRQRAWMAMALAQETSLLLLDEPTTYLDVAHQLEVTELVQRLNAEEGRTVVMVLHDVNEAAKVSHRIVAMQGGRIIREGTPAEIVEPELLVNLYGVTCDVYPHPETGQPFCVPRSAEVATNRRPATTSPGFDIGGLRSGYGRTIILRDLSLAIPAGKTTSIIGPNACGKSTLLRTCARLLPQQGGDIRLGERKVHQGSHRALARELALLAQGSIPPAGFLVEDLVAAGRTPHQSFWHQWRRTDETAVEGALTRCDLTEFRYREVATLSGGQRQRAWMAMALAQDTPVLLLDEPTTFLDIAAQIDLLDLVRQLNIEQGRTVVMILHDLNLAARYSDFLVAMKDGEIVTVGPPEEIITQSLLREVFSIEASIVTDPRTGTPLVMPSATLTTSTPDPALIAAVAQDLRQLSEAALD